jgi:hypothetical protein
MSSPTSHRNTLSVVQHIRHAGHTRGRGHCRKSRPWEEKDDQTAASNLVDDIKANLFQRRKRHEKCRHNEHKDDTNLRIEDDVKKRRHSDVSSDDTFENIFFLNLFQMKGSGRERGLHRPVN